MSNPFETSRETLKERTDVLLRSGELSDCVFIVGENEVKIVAHKIFMAMSSPAFYAMFYGDIAEKTDTVRIKDIEPSAFKGMLQYIYTDKVDFESCSHACLVYLSAKKYLLPFLEAQCEFYVETNVEPSTACEIYEWSKFHCIENIEEVCLKLFKENTEEVIVSQSFLDCDYSTVLTIAKMEELNLNSELKLFEAVEKWAINEAFRRGVSLEMLSSEMTDIISHIRFLSLSADEFTASQVNITTQGLTPLLSTEEKLAIVMNITHPGITPLPNRISDVSSPRKPKPPPVEPVPIEEEWSLRRECEDGALFPVTKWCNPFTRKGITVNRKIKVKGVKIGTQKKVSNLSSSNENVEMYQEKVTVVLKKDWSLKFFGSLYHSMTPYDSEVQINFNKPVPLEPNKLYWLIVNFDKGGTYSFLRDTHLVYNTHNLEIKMTEDFSAVTEIFFLDNEHNNSDTIACSNSCMIPPARAITAPSTSNSPSALLQTFMTNQTRRNSGSNSNSPSTPPSPSSPPT